MIRALATLLVVSLAALAQTVGKLEFEVVSVKPSAPPGNGLMTVGCHGGPGTDDPTLQICENWDLFNLVAIAYELNYFQVSAPDWMHAVRYDVRARIPAGTTKKQIGPMWQNMLADRFKLAAHREMREVQTYDLLVAKGGPKFKEASATPPATDASRSYSDLRSDRDGYPSFGPGHPGMAWSEGLASLYFPSVTMEWLAGHVSGQLGKPVNDKTGLNGKYEIALRWVSDQLADTVAGPRLVEALRDQLGLRLESRKAPAEILVVDHAERVPSDN